MTRDSAERGGLIFVDEPPDVVGVHQSLDPVHTILAGATPVVPSARVAVTLLAEAVAPEREALVGVVALALAAVVRLDLEMCPADPGSRAGETTLGLAAGPLQCARVVHTPAESQPDQEQITDTGLWGLTHVRPVVRVLSGIGDDPVRADHEVDVGQRERSDRRGDERLRRRHALLGPAPGCLGEHGAVHQVAN